MAEQMAIETELEHLKEILKRNKREYIHCPPHLEDMKPKGYDAEQCAIEYEHLVGYIEELIQCRAIGTVEELQALKDKSVAKKVVEIHKSEAIEDREYMGEEALYGYCPNCGGLICDVWNFVSCGECGQHVDWE